MRRARLGRAGRRSARSVARGGGVRRRQSPRTRRRRAHRGARRRSSSRATCPGPPARRWRRRRADGGADAGVAPPQVTNVGFQSPLVVPGGRASASRDARPSDAAAIGDAPRRSRARATGSCPSARRTRMSRGRATSRFTRRLRCRRSRRASHPLRFVAIDGSGQRGHAGRRRRCASSRASRTTCHACNPRRTRCPPPSSRCSGTPTSISTCTSCPRRAGRQPEDARSACPSTAGTSAADTTIRPSTATRCAAASPTACARRTWSSRSRRRTGTYLIYADPFDACGQPAVRFTFDSISEPGSDRRAPCTPTFTRSGELLAEPGHRRRLHRALRRPEDFE